ncbi:hypothetical protein [Rheinheimera sp. 4Y26]|uniref:hypothetical protein n=1 Tax=Rheinheimera sp. 4Y26 TaxID=2977811 RepID=UPI0021B145C7|nr:hypothetical protein [Rheinheimera sp. 4Y26]MCT6698318.1 hypothetical protein [Rheinheimera sp. 4Y26]
MTAICKFKLAALLLLCSSGSIADPTAPEAQLQPEGATAQAPESVPRLSLIRSDGRSYQALINGVLVKTGDKVGPYQVQRISAGQVILQQGEKRLQLNLFNSTTK